MRNLSIYRDKRSKRRRSIFGPLAGLAILWAISTVYALDPDRAISQYAHTQWGIENGFPGGTVYAITQTGDGYLWIGTEKGLVRFDGHADGAKSFSLSQPALTSAASATEPVIGLNTDPEGSLWVRLRSSNVLHYKNGKFINILNELEQVESLVTSMSRGTNGDILLSTIKNGILRNNGEKFVTLIANPNLPDINPLIISMAETPAGDIWLGTRDTGLLRLKDKQISVFTNELPDRKINCLVPDAKGGLWVGTDKGIIYWNGSEFTNSGVPPELNHIQALTMIRDRESNIWIGTDSHGLLRLDTNGMVSAEKDTHSLGGAITALFEDREGDVWAGSTKGIERLRNTVFTTYSLSEGNPSESNGPIYADPENRIWFALSDGGLYKLKGNQIESINNNELGKDIIYSITGDKDNIWVGRQRGGLSNLHFNGKSTTLKTYTQAEGLAQNSVYTVYTARDGTIWAGTLSGGVSRFKDGKFTTYTVADGLASNAVTAIMESTDGRIWFATPNGLSSLAKDRWQTYTAHDGLPSETINCLLEDLHHVIWIGTAKGLALLDSNGTRQRMDLPTALQGAILGMAEDSGGSLWLSTSEHVLQVNREKLLNGTITDTDIREYGIEDGLKSIEGVKRSQSVVKDEAGRIWFSMSRGISVVNPDQLKTLSAPALVQIQTILADGKPVDLREPVQISASQQKITFYFAGLSLSVPERVKFRYILEGFDPDWSEPTLTANAPYTNLNPGTYHFRVIASNSDGLWNSPEAVINIEITPMIWQTWWFRALGALIITFIIIAIYRLRLNQLTRQLNMRFDERLAERTRIAQELHDSLLQGILSASLQLDVEVENLPDASPLKPRLSRIHRLMGQVIEEGRNTLRGLRSSKTTDAVTLERAFSKIKHDLAIQESIDFRIIVEGPSRPLHPIVRDEIYLIGREALVNAFRHSGANLIEAELEYTAKYFRMLIRDNGCGINPNILSSGRDGHWGLSGMRERAENIRGRLKVWSRPGGGGTEIEFSLPNHIAFETQESSRPFKWLAKFYPRKKDKQSLEKEDDK